LHGTGKIVFRFVDTLPAAQVPSNKSYYRLARLTPLQVALQTQLCALVPVLLAMPNVREQLVQVCIYV
jgi:hypothetical protein